MLDGFGEVVDGMVIVLTEGVEGGTVVEQVGIAGTVLDGLVEIVHGTGVLQLGVNALGSCEFVHHDLTDGPLPIAQGREAVELYIGGEVVDGGFLILRRGIGDGAFKEKSLALAQVADVLNLAGERIYQGEIGLRLLLVERFGGATHIDAMEGTRLGIETFDVLIEGHHFLEAIGVVLI